MNTLMNYITSIIKNKKTRRNLMMSNFMKNMQVLNNELLDSNGRLLDDPRLSTLQGLEVRRIKFCSDFIQSVMNSKLICDETKFYIRSIGYSVKKAAEMYNKKLEKAGLSLVNYNTYNSKVNYDRVKLEKLFGDNMLDMVLESEKPNLKVYEERLYKALTKHKISSENRDELLLTLPNVVNTTSLSTEQFEKLLKVIRPYTKAYARQVVNQLSSEEIGYLNYLFNSNIEKFGLDKRNSDKLQELLIGEEKIVIKDELVNKNNIIESNKEIPVEEKPAEVVVEDSSYEEDDTLDVEKEVIEEEDNFTQKDELVEKKSEPKYVESNGKKYRVVSLDDSSAIIEIIDEHGMIVNRHISRKAYEEKYKKFF